MGSRQFTRVLAMLTMVVFTCPQPAFAQNVKALLRKGNKLFSNAEYEAAFDVFKQGYEKSKMKDPAFLRSMAFCQLKLYRHKEAREFLQEYIKKFPKAPDFAKLKDLESTLEVVVQTKVKIQSTPPGASIFIDAEAAGKVATTPKELTIEPGKHLVILKMDNYFTTTQSIEVKPKESKTLDVVLEVPISISSTPSGASVHYDSPDQPTLGNTPLSIGIKPGQRKVFLKKEGFKTFEASLNVAPGKEASISAELQIGVNVASTPPGAAVEVDGTPVEGQTPLEAPVKGPGEHTITVKLTPCTPHTEKVNVTPGQAVEVKAHLGGCGLLSMRTDVDGAEVFVGDKDVGQTPVASAAVAAGSQKVTVNHPDRRPWSGALDFSDSEVVNAKVTLGRKTWPAWTMAGVAGASLLLAVIATGMAAKDISDNEESKFRDGGRTSTSCVDTDGNPTDCPYTWHHVATASYSIAGVSAVASFIYYWFWARPKVEVSRTPVGQSSASR
jgi:hypothetical protein